MSRMHCDGRDRLSKRECGVLSRIALAAILVGSSSEAVAWSGGGHRLVARLAVATAPAGLPDFFRGGSEEIADASVEPDRRRAQQLPQLRAREYPEHYIDLEFLEGASLPPSRYEYLELLQKKDLGPDKVGFVPYSVVEATQHLAVAFTEHRFRPDNSAIRFRVLYLAGVLAHYAADMSQPLHTSKHHNGRALPDGSSPGTGIHHLVDPVLVRSEAVYSPAADTPWPRPFPDLVTGVFGALDSSHALVDRVYELEEYFEWEEGSEPRPDIREFASERLTASVLLTARLYATAWELSAELERASRDHRQAE
jgi:hypothetical protein